VDDEPPDPVLLAAVRAGDVHASGALYRRHVEPMRRTAVRLSHRPAERDDLVAEAFIRVITTVRAGGGPRENARPYLIVTMRNLAASWSRLHNRVDLCETVPEPAGARAVAEEEAVRRSDIDLVWSAYCTLPGRWRTVLWRTAAEGDSTAQAALLLGVSPNGASVLAGRAREGLRQAYLQVQVPHAEDPYCAEARRNLGAWVRGGLSQRRSTVIGGHLAACAPCRVVTAGLAEVNDELPA
jgi:RNA polymerase sigma factor (sigma-70 family)